MNTLYAKFIIIDKKTKNIFAKLFNFMANILKIFLSSILIKKNGIENISNKTVSYIPL
jgi:hypothetical protein